MRGAAAAFLNAMWRRTPRNPGADLSRLPVGLDFNGIRVAEGVRAALACAVVILFNEWLQWPSLNQMALAAYFTCLCDIGGPIRTRLPALLSFTLLGALVWAGFGLLRGMAGLPAVVPLACLGIVLCSFARVWGAAATAVGNILAIVLILALDVPLRPAEALEIGGTFVAGGLWATLLALVIWRLHPYRPARAAVAEIWRRMAGLVTDLRDLLARSDVGPAEWEAHARAHRRAVREEIEFARTLVMDLVSLRGRLSLRGSQALLRLEAADQLFGTLIALSELLENAEPPARRQAAAALLRRLRPTLTVLSHATLTDQVLAPERMERSVRELVESCRDDPALFRLAEAIADRLRIVAKLSTPGGYAPGGPLPGDAGQPWQQRLLGPLRANLSWNSAMLRHALRTGAVAAPALAATLIWENPFGHWLTITAVLTLQPFYAATWQRALERVGGTVLGGLAGALLALAAPTPVLLAGLLFPLCALAFAARQVSFSVWIAGVTPVVVVLTELSHPGLSSWEIAEQRTVFTLAGGAVAVLGWLLLWPSWEPDRLRGELRAALLAHGRYARAVLAGLAGEAAAAEATEAARREAGMATNNLEASLSRALQEPGQGRRAEVEAAMVVDAGLRRIAGRLSALGHDAPARTALDPAGWRRWADWAAGALAGLAGGAGGPVARPEDAPAEPLARIARQIEMLEAPLRRVG
ncbi:FUSC family protein [Roseomonas sp. BN140053]|uniref:FUSC family protein n=1 Tax=Roseomonas sp. BN140053 TaxID=3391898 RepID=UPI0039EC8DD9